MHTDAFQQGYIAKTAKDKVEAVMGEFKRGKLRSGSEDGPVVKDKDQAIAIALSEQDKEAGLGSALKSFSPRMSKRFTRAKQFATGDLGRKMQRHKEDMGDSLARRQGDYGMDLVDSTNATQLGPSPGQISRFQRGPLASYNKNLGTATATGVLGFGSGAGYGLTQYLLKRLNRQQQGQEQ
jgi:hypothetical protein